MRTSKIGSRNILYCSRACCFSIVLSTWLKNNAYVIHKVKMADAIGDSAPDTCPTGQVNCRRTECIAQSQDATALTLIQVLLTWHRIGHQYCTALQRHLLPTQVG